MELQNLQVTRGTLKVGRIVPIIFRAFRGRFELYRTTGAPGKTTKSLK
jgi:hypothetical protein